MHYLITVIDSCFCSSVFLFFLLMSFYTVVLSSPCRKSLRSKFDSLILLETSSFVIRHMVFVGQCKYSTKTSRFKYLDSYSKFYNFGAAFKGLKG